MLGLLFLQCLPSIILVKIKRVANGRLLALGIAKNALQTPAKNRYFIFGTGGFISDRLCIFANL